MNSLSKLFSGLLVCSLFFLSSCRHDMDSTNVPTVTFGQVQGILSGSCGMEGCHGDDDESRFSLIGYDHVMEKVEAGDAHKSELYKVLLITSGEKKMPPDPSSPLNHDDIKRIYIWIEQGAKNN